MRVLIKPYMIHTANPFSENRISLCSKFFPVAEIQFSLKGIILSVFYMLSDRFILAVESGDLSQAEKELTACKAE